MTLEKILSVIPDGLKKPLLAEYNSIVQHFMERRWTASELSGGKFCEVVYTILEGYAKGVYQNSPSKPSNFVDACKKLENHTNVSRSFQILLPRMLPPLYEVRNNRNVGHVGGEVDSNSMDSAVVMAMCSWIMGELIRVLHNMKIEEAQKAVDLITNRKIPLVWETQRVKRVLDTKMKLKDQILLLVASNQSETSTTELFIWLDYANKKYYWQTLRELHKKRLLELFDNEQSIEILPPGTLEVEKIISKITI